MLPRERCRCGLPLPAATAAPPADELPPLCGRCLANPPPFARVCCEYPWRFPLDRLISRYKYRSWLAAERPLLALWQQALAATGMSPRPDALVPVPLHWRRQWWRGFNQSERLARQLARLTGIPHLPALARRRATPRQQGLKQSTRRRNLRNAFAVQCDVDGLRLALVDDVITTGSTAREASRALLDAGAARVEVWALARTLPASDQ